MKISWCQIVLPFTLFFAPTVLSTETLVLLPFSSPKDAENINDQRAFEVLQLLKKRADNCPNGYNPCSNMGNSNVCCQDGTRCTKDAANYIACCPTGASCTGSLGGGFANPTGTQTSSSFMFPQPGSATPTTTFDSSDPQITGSTLVGAAYPFVYVPTTFDNAATCSAYYSMCQSDYSKCTSTLGARYGVTVAGGGAGVTVGGAAEPSAVISTCSSLSMEACHGLHLGNCESYGGGGSNPENGASGGGRTSFKDLVLGLAVGVAGMFI